MMKMRRRLAARHRPADPTDLGDALRARLAAVDPARPEVFSATPWSPQTPNDHLMVLTTENTMDTTSSHTTNTTPPHPRRPRMRLVPTLAVAAVTVIALIGLGAGLGAGLGGPGASPAGEPLVLTAPGDDLMAMCLAFDPTALAQSADLAFEGTVLAAESETVRLSVAHWFRADEASRVVTEVELHAPAGMEALIGGFPFEEGEVYLISAFDGTVNYCGFSGPATEEFRAAFEEAFAGE